MANESFIQQRRFSGLDLYTAPQDLTADKLTQSDNCVNYGGELYSRPGFQAVLATVLGAAPYAMTEFERSDQSTVILYVSGGKLYMLKPGTIPASTSEIKIGGTTSFSLASANAQIYVEGKYAYVVDGVGSLYRVNVNADDTYTAVAVTGLTAPTSAPNVSLTYTTVDAFNTTTGWSADYLSFSSTSLTITGVSSTTPMVVSTSTNHEYSTNDIVYVDGVTGITAANGTWQVGTIVSATQFQLLYVGGSNSTTNGSYVSGGTVKRLGTTTALTAAAGTNLLPQKGLYTSWAQSGGNWVNNGNAGWTGHNWGGGTLLLGVANGLTAPDGSSVNAVQLDVTVDGFDLTSPVPNYSLTNDPTRYAKDAYISLTLFANATTSSMDVIVTAFSDTAGTVSLGSRTINLKARIIGAQSLAGVVSFADIDTDIRAWTVQFHAGKSNYGSGDATEPSIAQLVFYPIVGNGVTSSPGGATFSLSAGQIAIDAQPAAALLLPTTEEYVGALHLTKDLIATGASPVTITGATNATPIVATTGTAHGLADGNLVAVRGVVGNTAANGVYYAKVTGYSTTTFGLYSDSGLTTAIAGNGSYVSGGTVVKLAAVDFSNTQQVDIGFKQLMEFDLTTLAFRVGLRNSAGINTSLIAQLSSDGTYYSADISALSTAQRQNIGAIEIIPVTDLAVSGAVKPLFALGPMTTSGNLTVGSGDYVWVVVEAQDTSKDVSGNSTGITTDGIVESNPSPPTSLITPTLLSAQTSMTLGAFVNSNANYFEVYRLGGPFQDPIATYRLIAKLPRWSDTIDSSSPGANYCTWNHTTRTFTDNTPDGALFSLVPTLTTGHDGPPTGATCVAGYKGRLALAKASTLYVSSLLYSDAAAALYYPTTNVPGDPAGDTKGWVAPVSPNDNDTIKQIVSADPYLVIMKTKSVVILSGDTPSNFDVLQHLKKGGVGLAAPHAVALVEDNPWLLGINAIWEYDGGEQVTKVSLPIEPSLAPQTRNNTALSASARAGAVALYSGQRFYLAIPGSATSTGNDTIWMFDHREQANGIALGWTKWTPPAGVNITSLCSMSAIGDSDDLYAGGSDGQIYHITGAGDVTSIVSITGATNASPIVATTSAVHGLADGNTVIVRGLGGNTAANGTYYAKVTGYSTTTFGLYSDSALTVPVAGNGAYTSGGAAGKGIAVTITGKTRGMMQEASGQTWFMTNRPTRMLAKFTAGEACTATLTCSVAGGSNTSSVAHSVSAGVGQLRDKVGSDVRGDAVFVALSMSTIRQSKITSLAVEAAEGSMKGTA